MRSKRRVVVVGLLAAASVLVTGCDPREEATPSASPSVALVVATDLGADLRFVPAEVAAPARTRIRVTFHNVSTQPHNLTFKAPITGGTRTIVEAGGSDVIELVTTGPGRYVFACTIHMGMSGAVVVH